MSPVVEYACPYCRAQIVMVDDLLRIKCSGCELVLQTSALEKKPFETMKKEDEEAPF